MNKIQRDFINRFLELRRKLTAIIFYNIRKDNNPQTIGIADAVAQSVLLSLVASRFLEYKKGRKDTTYKDFFSFIKGRTPPELMETRHSDRFSTPITLDLIKKSVPFEDKDVVNILNEILNFKQYDKIDNFYFLSRISEEMISFIGSFYGSRVSFSIANEWRSNSGSFFTPKDCSEFIIEELWNKSKKDYRQKFIDPTCGTGNLIIAYIKKLVKNFKPSEVIYAIENCIYGFDTNMKSLEILRYSLWGICSWLGKNSSKIGKNLYNIDFMNSSSVLSKKLRFDVCASNPPYICPTRTQYLKAKKDPNISHDAKYLYTYIMEKTISLMKPEGVSAFVFPSNVFTGKQYREVRGRLLSLPARLDVFSFDTIPSTLFDQYKYSLTPFGTKSKINVRASILIIKGLKDRKGLVRTTRMIRFKASERGNLFLKKNLKLCTIPRRLINQLDCIPQVSFPKEVKILSALMEYKTIGTMLSDKMIPSVGFLEVNVVGRYFLYTSIGKSIYPSSKFRLYPKTQKDLYNLYCYLNSNLFYWYWRKVTNTKTLNKYFLEKCPIPIIREDIAKFYAKKLKKAEKQCTIRKMSKTGERKNVNFNKKYLLLTEIDRAFLKSMDSSSLWSVIKRSKSNSLYFKSYPF
jgi:hypothetical protein